MKRMKRHKVKKEKPETTAYDRVLQEHDLAYYIHDRVELMHQVFSVIKAKDLRSMAPESVRRVSIDDLQELCTEELLGISSKRLCAILDGAEPPSDTESSSRSRSSSPPVETISLDSISSDDDMLSQASKRRKKKRRNSKSKPKKDKTKSKKDVPEGPAPPPELTDQSRASRAGLTVLELLELQARARAIRAQLQQEQARKAAEPAPESVTADDDDEDVEIKEEQPEVVEISSEDDEKPDVHQLDKANATISKQAEPTVNGKEKPTEVAGKNNGNAKTTENPNKNAEKKKKDKGKKKKKDKDSDKSKEDSDIAKTSEVNTNTSKEISIATTSTTNDLNAILSSTNKETATTSTDSDVITIVAETLPEINKETTTKVTKRVNDLIITVPQQISRKIKLNRSKMTVSVANAENDSSTDRSVISVTDNVPRIPESIPKVSSVVTKPPERLSSIVTKPDVRTKLIEIRQRKNNTKDKEKSIEKEDINTVQEKSNQANINMEDKDKKRDKPKKAKKRVKRKSTTDKENASDQDEITLQLSDSEKMDLLEDLDRKQYDKVSSTEESDSNSSTDSDSDNDTVNKNGTNITSNEKNAENAEKPESPEFANKTDMITDGTIAIEVIEVNNFYAGIEELDQENENMPKTGENVQENDRNDEGEAREENTQKMVHVDENSRDKINQENDENLKTKDKENQGGNEEITQDEINKEIDKNLKTQDKDKESEQSAESSDSDSDSKTSQSSDNSDQEHETHKNDAITEVNQQGMPEKGDLGHQDENISTISDVYEKMPVNTDMAENNENTPQLYEDEEIPEKQVTFLKENQNVSENITPEAKITLTTEELGYISIDKESERNNIEIADIFDIPVINDEATSANENDICSNENKIQSDVAKVTENPQATDDPEVIENLEVDKVATEGAEAVEQNNDSNETEVTNNIAKETVEITDANKQEENTNQALEVMNTEVDNIENIEKIASSETSDKTVSVEVSDKTEERERDSELKEKEKERELSEGEVSTAESSEVEAMEWKPEVVCISDEDEKEPVAAKKKKKKEKKPKKDKKEKKSKKNKSDFRESGDQNFYTLEKVIFDEINAVIDEIIDDKGHLIKEVKQDVIVIDKGDVKSYVEKPIKDLDTISVGSNDDVYEILDSDDSSCYEVEGTVLSKEPTADEIAALSAKIDEIERDDIITDEQIEEHERMLKEKDKGEENLTENLKLGEFDKNTEENMSEKGIETDKNTENMTEKAKENEFYKTTVDKNNEEEENVENVSWKDRYLGSKKVKKVLTTSNIFNALRKKNKELKKKIQQSKIKEAEELKKQEVKLKEIPVIVEKLLEEGSIEHYNTLQGSTRYVDPAPDPEELKKAEEEKKHLEGKQENPEGTQETPEGTQKNLEGTEQNAEVRIKNLEIEVTGEMKKDAKQLLKIYKKLLKYNDITKQKDPNKVKKNKKKSKKKDGGNVAIASGATV